MPKTAYAQAVYQHTPAEVEHATKVGKLAGELEVAEVVRVLDDGIVGKVSGVTMVLQPLSERAKEERIKLAGQKRKRKGEAEEPMDDKQRAEYFLSTHSYTSEALGARRRPLRRQRRTRRRRLRSARRHGRRRRRSRTHWRRS